MVPRQTLHHQRTLASPTPHAGTQSSVAIAQKGTTPPRRRKHVTKHKRTRRESRPLPTERDTEEGPMPGEQDIRLRPRLQGPATRSPSRNRRPLPLEQRFLWRRPRLNTTAATPAGTTTTPPREHHTIHATTSHGGLSGTADPQPTKDPHLTLEE